MVGEPRLRRHQLPREVLDLLDAESRPRAERKTVTRMTGYVVTRALGDRRNDPAWERREMARLGYRPGEYHDDNDFRYDDYWSALANGVQEVLRAEVDDDERQMKQIAKTAVGQWWTRHLSADGQGTTVVDFRKATGKSDKWCRTTLLEGVDSGLLRLGERRDRKGRFGHEGLLAGQAHERAPG